MFSAKKVASGDVIDGAEESVSAVGVAGSPKGAQAAPEETASSGQASEQAVSGQEISQKKRRRKTKDETNNKEVKSPSENAMVQSGLSKGEKRKSKFLIFFFFSFKIYLLFLKIYFYCRVRYTERRRLACFLEMFP